MRVLDAGLVVVAAAGALVLLARLAGALLGLELVMFATGSMSPGYPQGSVAIAQHVPLSSVRVGDVVTIDRAGQLPITHRVVRIAVEGDRAVVRLKGDANRHPDPAPYRTDHLTRVVADLPAVLWPLRFAGTFPAAVASALVGALAVGWGLWPRRAAAPAVQAASPA